MIALRIAVICLHAKLTIAPSNKDLRHAIDLEVIKQRANVMSELAAPV